MGVGFADTSPNGSWIYQDDLTWIHGAHSFRFGYEYKRYFYNDRALSDAGDFTFSARQTDSPGQLTSTGNAFASFLLGRRVPVDSQHPRLFASVPAATTRHVCHGRLEDHAAADAEFGIALGDHSAVL